MKYAASISLLAILAFNWVGYRLVSGIFENRASLALESRIDQADYDESSLIEIRVPMNMPYLPGNSADFERYDGDIELNGIHYKYVKRKVENGELVLLCLPNETKTRFQNARVDFFKLVNDLNSTSQSKEKGNTSSFKNFTTEYQQEKNMWVIASLAGVVLKHAATNTSQMARGFTTIPDQPPRINC